MNTISNNGGAIYRLLIDAGFSEKFAQWITSQAAHETTNFTSYIFNKNNNAFGMKFQGQKTASGEKNGYAYYDEGLAGSVADYKRLFKSYGLVSVATVESFVKLLKDQEYFEAPYDQYLAGVKYYLKRYFPAGSLDKSLKIAGAGGTW